MLGFAGFQLDQQRAELRGSDGEVIKLRPKPFDMLVFFATNAGRVIGKRELMEQFWPGVHVGEDSLFQCIREIRAALGDSRRQIIRNISGRGYMFEAEVTEVTAAALDVLPQVEVPPSAAEPQDGVMLPAVLPAVAPILPAVGRTGGRRWMIAGATIAAAMLAAVMLIVPLIDPAPVAGRRPAVSVMAMTTASTDSQIRAMAAGVTDRLSTGLARIENIRVVTPPQVTARASLEPMPARSGAADYVINGELQKEEQGWMLRARMTRSATGEIAWASDVEVAAADVDSDTQQSRLAAAIGHPLALRINAILNDAVPGAGGKSGSAKVAVEQATASIVQTSIERFRVAQTMLEKALAENPDDIDVEAALAALKLRGIQMVWYKPEDREAMRDSAQAAMERVLRVKPTYVPVLESYCRLLSATNQFIDSLVACARTLSFDPWNGLAIYHIGLGQIFLGRFEDAVTNFKLADQYDTPTVSRWTWLLGAGVALVYLDRDEEAAKWLERSLAVTPGTGRTHFTLMAAYQKLGRHADAHAMLMKGLELRPGATADNIGPPTENTSPVFLEAAARVRDVLVEAGLPRR